MRLLDNSITIVILGDWNKMFIQPDWIAHNVFESEEIVKRIFNILKEEDFHISTIEIQLNCKGKEKVIKIEDMKY